MKEIKYRTQFCDSLFLRFRIWFQFSGTKINYGSGSAKVYTVIKLRLMFRYGKKLRFLRFRFRNTVYLSQNFFFTKLQIYAFPKKKKSIFVSSLPGEDAVPAHCDFELIVENLTEWPQRIF